MNKPQFIVIIALLIKQIFVCDSSRGELVALFWFASCFHALQGPTNSTSHGFCCHIRNKLSSSIKQPLGL